MLRIFRCYRNTQDRTYGGSMCTPPHTVRTRTRPRS